MKRHSLVSELLQGIMNRVAKMKKVIVCGRWWGSALWLQ